ncbi:MAG: zinc ribbon domain-containing protein [Oscillospiraceae bacterium]|nr:zinc ribbon domain-containing protein [Oscillospiraceae bacterium]
MSKVCPNCGKEINDEAEFCPYCGETSIPKAPSVDTEHLESPLPAESDRQSVSFFREGNQTGKGLVTYFCGNWMALVFAILLTLSTAFYLIDTIDVMVNDGILDGAIPLLSVAFYTILCIGCWIAFADAARHNMKPRGLSVISAGLLVAIIVDAVMYAVECILLGFFVAAFEGAIPFILLLIVYLIIAVLTILTYITLRRTVRSGRDFLNGDSPSWKVSMFAEIMLIIIAAFTLVMIFFAEDIFSILYNIVDLAVCVFAIIILFRIRRAAAR